MDRVARAGLVSRELTGTRTSFDAWNALVLAGLGLAYYLTAVAGHATLMLMSWPSIAVLWPPNVLLLVAFLVAPIRLWPAIVTIALAAQVAVALTLQIPIARALAMFTGNISQPLVGAGLLRWLGQNGNALETLKGVTAFVGAAALIAPAAGSLVSAVTLSATGWITDPWAHWRMRFVTNVLSTIVLAPPLLGLVNRKPPPRPLAPAIAEFAMLLMGVTVSERLVNSLITPITASPLLFAPLPFLLWAAVRFGQAGLGLVLCYTALFRYFAEAHPGQVFASEPDAVVATQLTLIAISLPLVFLSALLAERRHTEEALRTGHARYELATSAGFVGVWDWNLETNDIYVDPALKRFLGYADHEIVNHLDEWGRHVHPDDQERVSAAVQAHLDGRADAFEVPHRMLHRDGSIRWFLARGSVVERNGGRATRMIGTDTDITTQKQAEQALEQAKLELARLTRLSDMGGLAAAISHEVNQPLCAIVSNASAALRWLNHDELKLAEIRAALEDVVREGKRAGELIGRTRRFFQGEIERQPINLNNSLQTALGLTRGSLQGSGVVVREQLDTTLPPVSADAVQLQQVFCNLIVNAVEAMKEHGDSPATLTLITRRHDVDGVYASVADNGRGFGHVDPEHAFRPLVTTTRGGMGIGLTMSRAIVEMYGGRLWATTNEDAGATFHLVLPGADEAETKAWQT
jgi:two-component system, LuxR family, sensor kinase FixL